VLGRLLLEDVAREGVPAADLAGGGQLEALLGAGMGLHLGHGEQRSMADGAPGAGDESAGGGDRGGARAGGGSASAGGGWAGFAAAAVFGFAGRGFGQRRGLRLRGRRGFGFGRSPPSASVAFGAGGDARWAARSAATGGLDGACSTTAVASAARRRPGSAASGGRAGCVRGCGSCLSAARARRRSCAPRPVRLGRRRRGRRRAACRRLVERPARTALEGAIIIVMLRPSCIGRCSTTPTRRAPRRGGRGSRCRARGG
jgi:hypothetical protein